jgi:endonuclease/exonuclease/phosphatase family metal-dependent hydrolase
MEMKIITSNVSADFLTPPGVPPWEERKELYAQVLRHAAPDILGFQEVTPRQFAFWQAQLPQFTALTISPSNPDPALLAVWQAKYGRLGFDAIPSPYEIVLFYRTELFEQRATGHWWLSPTPDRISIGFGNSAPRVVLWACLVHRASGSSFYIFNTHLDHRCIQPMVELCRERFIAFSAAGVPLIFIGDLNFNPDDLNYSQLAADGWRDSHSACAQEDCPTFLYNQPDVPSGRIDHILYRGDGLKPQAWMRLNSPDTNRHLSDHDPVCVRFCCDEKSDEPQKAQHEHQDAAQHAAGADAAGGEQDRRDFDS